MPPKMEGSKKQNPHLGKFRNSIKDSLLALINNSLKKNQKGVFIVWLTTF